MITIYSMTMLVWGSRYRWTLASTLALRRARRLGDRRYRRGDRLDHPVQLPPPQHRLGRRALPHLPDADRRRLAARVHRAPARARRRRDLVAAARTWTIALLLVGGFGLTGTWFVEGALGIPRRYAIQPPGTAGYSLAGSIFALVFALGVLACVAQLVSLARTAWTRRHYVLVDHVDSWTGPTTGTRRAAARTVGRRAARAAEDVPLASPPSSASAPRPASSRSPSFFPQIVTASEASTRYHHLDHAGHFFLGLMVGLMIGSLPAVSRRLGDRSALGLAAVIVAPTAMMLVMVPRFYEPLERHPFEHALYHLAMAAFGLVTGLAASRLGRSAAGSRPSSRSGWCCCSPPR